MNLKRYDTVAACDAGAEMELKDPFTGEPTGDFITVVGVDSSTFQESQRRAFDARVRKGDASASHDDVKAEVIGVLADCTRSWRISGEDGQPLPFSRDAAIDLYTKYPRIKDQVNSFIGGVANFRRD
jgi:hypothetical protein